MMNQEPRRLNTTEIVLPQEVHQEIRHPPSGTDAERTAGLAG